MSNFVDNLKLDFDPLEAERQVVHFFPGGERQEVLQQLINSSYYSTNTLVVTGPLGSGKTCLSHSFCRSFADEAILVRVSATLFMSEIQLLESICEKAGVDYQGMANSAQLIDRLVDFSALIARESRTVNIVIDDAHELGLEAFEALGELLLATVDASTHLLLLGEKQMMNVLENMRAVAFSASTVSIFDLVGLGAEQTKAYLQFKLHNAGYKGEFPLSGAVVGEIANKSQGLPGSINGIARQYLSELEETAISASSNPLSLIPVKYFAIFASLVVALLLVVFQTGGDTGDASVVSGQSARQSLPVTVGAISDVTHSGQQPLDETEAVASSSVVSVATDSVAAQLAQELVATSAAPEVSDDSQEAREVSGDDQENNASQNDNQAIGPASSRVFSAFEQSLLAANTDNFILQLLGTRSESSARAFVAENQDQEGYGYFRTRYEGGPWFVVVYGNYESRELAIASIQSLPLTQRRLQPWARSIGSVQVSIESP